MQVYTKDHLQLLYRVRKKWGGIAIYHIPKYDNIAFCKLLLKIKSMKISIHSSGVFLHQVS